MAAPLTLRLCTPAALGDESEATIAQLSTRLPQNLFALAPTVSCATLAAETEATADVGPAVTALAALQGDADGAANAAAAAATLLHLSTTLHASEGEVGKRRRLLIACVDATDGRTLAAALAARLSQARLLNVCDEPLSTRDELGPDEKATRVHSQSSGGQLVAEALSAAVGCALSPDP